jgi:hypothetical protein
MALNETRMDMTSPPLDLDDESCVVSLRPTAVGRRRCRLCPLALILFGLSLIQITTTTTSCCPVIVSGALIGGCNM